MSAAMAKLSTADLEKIFAATHTGMTVEAFQQSVREWIATASTRAFRKRIFAFEP